MKRCIALSIVAIVGTACAAPPAPPRPAVAAPAAASTAASTTASTVDLYKSLERKQCEAGGETLDTLRAKLQRAGVTPTAASCGTDGMMRAAMCGMGTGDIGIFTVRKDEVVRAAKAGFRPLADLRDAERTPCPGENAKTLKK